MEAALKSYYGADTLGIRAAVSGSSITTWQVGQTNYQNAVQMTLDAIAAGYTVKAGLFFQGETDANNPTVAAQWKQLYWDYTRDFRLAIGYQYMPMVHAQLGKKPELGGYAEWATVRQQQADALVNHPGFQMIGTYDLYPYYYSDVIPYCHYNPTGYEFISLRFISKLLNVVPVV
jgi:Carbohydrate esterase, sialic acid-specific acetylesterase